MDQIQIGVLIIGFALVLIGAMIVSGYSITGNVVKEHEPSKEQLIYEFLLGWIPTHFDEVRLSSFNATKIIPLGDGEYFVKGQYHIGEDVFDFNLEVSDDNFSIQSKGMDSTRRLHVS